MSAFDLTCVAHGIRSPPSVSWSSPKARHGRDSSYLPGRFYMSRAKRASKAERRIKAVPVLGAAGLSLTLASGAYGASSTSAADVLSRSARVTHEISLREEEISEVSLATFHAFDKESHAGQRLACGCGGGCCLFARAPSSGNDAYSPPPISPAHKHVRKKP